MQVLDLSLRIRIIASTLATDRSALHSIHVVFTVPSTELMTLLVHLWVLAVWRLRVTIVGVTTRTVVRIVGSRILCHALRETGTVCAVLRSSRGARSSRLVPNGWKLRV